MPSLLDAFVTYFNLRRTNRGSALKFPELMFGRVKVVIAQFPVWVRTYQSKCLNFNADLMDFSSASLTAPGWQVGELLPCTAFFLGATSCSNNTAELIGFAEALRWIDSFIFPW